MRSVSYQTLPKVFPPVTKFSPQQSNNCSIVQQSKKLCERVGDKGRNSFELCRILFTKDKCWNESTYDVCSCFVFCVSEDLSGEVGCESSSLSLSSQLYCYC